MGRDKSMGRNGIPKPAGAGGGSSSLSLEPFRGSTRLNHLEITLRLRGEGRQPFAISSAVGLQFVEQNKRSPNSINFNDSATVEAAQRGGVLDRPGVRNPGCQDRPFPRRQLRIARDVIRVRADRRRRKARRRRSRLPDWKGVKLLLISILRNQASRSGPGGGPQDSCPQIRRPSWRSGRSAFADCPALQPSFPRRSRPRCAAASAAPAPRAGGRS